MEIPANIKSLTGIRGFAALWVVLFHIQGGPFSRGLIGGEFLKHGFWGVDVFFVLFREAIVNLALLHAWGVTHVLSWNDVSWSISTEWFAYLTLLVPCLRFLRGVNLGLLYLLPATAWCFVIFVYLRPERQVCST